VKIAKMFMVHGSWKRGHSGQKASGGRATDLQTEYPTHKKTAILAGGWLNLSVANRQDQ
jgi:hypothetical protein